MQIKLVLLGQDALLTTSSMLLTWSNAAKLG
jgi:hypothetical protein